MKWFSKNRGQLPEVQTCASADRGLLETFQRAYSDPIEQRLYRELRSRVPVIDAALSKIVRLTGDYRLLGADERAQRALDSFASDVKVGGVGFTLKSFTDAYLSQLLTYGIAVGEIAVYDDGRVAALMNAPAESIELRQGENPLDVRVFVRDGLQLKEAEHPELILTSLLDPEPGSLRGNSLLKGLGFVSEILMKIFECIGQNFDRAGNVRFAVTYNPPSGSPTVNSRQRVKEIADEWSRAMRDKSRVCDFVSVGDVKIKAIGADSQIIDCDIPIRHILEQIVAKLSIPPFLLGLSWSSTERMSAQQADILTSELEYYRSILDPVIRKIAVAFLKGEGLDPNVRVEWSNISLQDETELASARLNNARASQLEQSMEVKN